jgi:hypothetical protein
MTDAAITPDTPDITAEVDGDEVIMRLPRHVANGLLLDLIELEHNDGDARQVQLDLGSMRWALTDALLPVRRS